MRSARCLLAIAILFPAVTAAATVSPVRAVTTYSIVARDPATGDLGVAVQSHWFSVGALVPWARAGVGAVATQSMVDPSYGPLGLELMAAGKDAPTALGGLLAADPHLDIRQVGMVDAAGRVAAHTGVRCIPEAGHRTGDGYAVQANLMGPPTVPDAMASAFAGTTGPLAERLLAALAAAEAAGGDIRGRQSAAILVVRGEATGRVWDDVLVDLRVEDHPDPVAELARLVRVHRGYEQMNAGDLAVERGDLAAAQAAYAEAERILGDNLEARFWHAVALANAGRLEEALPIFADVFARGDNWRELVPRLVAAEFLQADATALQRIAGAGR
ncbi:MAG TPA: DUF1028 domain-containing protein [Candidatus Krumholzibacteria bacterium]|nr:DUF1028 domain-containing protein [Candidatus Krumholzibacteria bacterium]HPD72571.1 DUF1028 domain-containing protein [Candidatus Krumholzibacteria bacterium]HRY40497.1 DUF1028 domain-containing protein [Candidatus Krumholzibacteria bacterium]